MRTTLLHKDSISPDPANIRTQFRGIDELAATIARVGLLQNIIVRPKPGEAGHYVIVAGERRYRACLKARLDVIPCSIRQQSFPRKTIVQMMIIENDQRDPLTPVARARAYDELRKEGLSVSLIAEGIGRSASHVYAYLDLMECDDGTLARVEAGEIRWQDAGKAAREMRQRRRSYTSPARTSARRKKVTFEPDTLTSAHPLAELVRARCRAFDHHLIREKVYAGQARKSAVGCGECWEYYIRADAIEHLTSDDVAAWLNSHPVAEWPNVTATGAISTREIDPLEHFTDHDLTATPGKLIRARFGDKPRRTIRLGSEHSAG